MIPKPRPKSESEGSDLRIRAQIVAVRPYFIDVDDHRVIGRWEIELAAVRVDGSIEEAQRYLREATVFDLVARDETR